MSEQEIMEEILYQEDNIRCYYESLKAYDWVVKNVYAKEGPRR